MKTFKIKVRISEVKEVEVKCQNISQALNIVQNLKGESQKEIEVLNYEEV